MALEFEGDMFDGWDGHRSQGSRIKGPRRKAEKPRRKPEKKAVDSDPLLSPAPYAKRIKDVMLAAGWQIEDKDFTGKFGFSSDTVRRIYQGKGKASVLFVRRLVRLEAMYEKELEAVHKGLIKMEKFPRNKHLVRVDLRRQKSPVEESKRGL